MSKSAIVEAVYKQHTLATKSGKPLSRAAIGRLVDSVFDNAAKSLSSSGYFRYPGFGSFYVRERAARTAFRNLPKRKGEAVDRSDANKVHVPASETVGFKPSQTLKTAVKGVKRQKRRTGPNAKEQEIV